MEPQLLLATMNKPFQHLKNPKKIILQSTFHYSRTWDVLNISTLLSTGDGNVQGHGLYTVLLPLLNSSVLASFTLTYCKH